MTDLASGAGGPLGYPGRLIKVRKARPQGHGAGQPLIAKTKADRGFLGNDKLPRGLFKHFQVGGLKAVGLGWAGTPSKTTAIRHSPHHSQRLRVMLAAPLLLPGARLAGSGRRG